MLSQNHHVWRFYDKRFMFIALSCLARVITIAYEPSLIIFASYYQTGSNTYANTVNNVQPVLVMECLKDLPWTLYWFQYISTTCHPLQHLNHFFVLMTKLLSHKCLNNLKSLVNVELNKAETSCTLINCHI